ncbi:hypothetical protein EDB92DRAFT_1834731 [Lactarius akahatsu]|uniref:C2H2-type domain-containing protein n=1 Tax=Lactarius akahatsu TaxID=416441 RepID=A0AAD4LRJ8_9AGAM|nr:hypothetical protein EDB92DRAFT_1834731 [Lactarius akahatsu]
MPQETERVSPLDIDTVAKLVIQPITCSWIGCAATMNSWHTLQKHFQLHCQDAAASIKPKGKVLVACQIAKCLDHEHNSLATLEEHIKISHLFPLPLPCPALGKMSLCSNCPTRPYCSFLEQHQKLLHTNHQGHLFKPQASLSLHQPLQSLPLLPLKSKFSGYKLVSYATAIRLPFDEGVNCLAESIGNLKVTQSPKEPKVMIASTFKQNIHSLVSGDDLLRHSFPDLSPMDLTYRYQHTNSPSNSQAEFKLSAPPPWKLDTDAPVDKALSIGYGVFVNRNS